MLKSGGRYNTVKRSPRWIRSESFDSKRQSDHTDLHVYNQKGGNSLCPSQPNCFRFMTLMYPKEHNSKGWFQESESICGLGTTSLFRFKQLVDESNSFSIPVLNDNALQCEPFRRPHECSTSYIHELVLRPGSVAIATTLEGDQGYAFPLFVRLHVVSRKFG